MVLPGKQVLLEGTQAQACAHLTLGEVRAGVIAWKKPRRCNRAPYTLPAGPTLPAAPRSSAQARARVQASPGFRVLGF